MRLYLHADCENKPRFRLPWNYHLSVMNFVYESIGNNNSSKATELHQKKDAPPFSFSNFIQKGPFQVVDDGISFSRGYFCFSSEDAEIIKAIADSIPDDGELMIGNTKVPVISQTTENVSEYEGETTYESLSPIAISELEPTNNSQREWYIPSDSMWGARIKENIEGRMKGYNCYPDDFKFKIVDFDWVDKKVKRLTSEVEIPCVRTRFTLDTDKRTSKFIQNNGLGQRTGMGFGNTIAVEDMPTKWR